MSDYRVPSLMYDHNYRMAIAWQNTGYNQPPHIGYYLPDWIDQFQGVADEIEETIKGDINNDTYVNITDVVTLINAIAKGEYDAIYDVNGDEHVDITDVVTIINIIAGM